MTWNNHSKLEGSHAFLSASKYTWINKTDEELIQLYTNSYAQSIGTLLHAYAADSIKFREKLRKTDIRGVKFDLMRSGIPENVIDIGGIFPTLMEYVNDAIDYRMDPEVVLYYSDLCFGTADAIQFTKNKLRIHDLKTGVKAAKMDQLMIYASLFFLEYGFKPEKVPTELRIYQSGEVLVYQPEPEEIASMMAAIIDKDRVLQKMKEE